MKLIRRMLLPGMASLCLLLGFAAADAHTSGTSFLALRAQDSTTLEAQWDFALQDLHQLLDLDADVDGSLTWGEVLGARAEIEALALERTRLTVADVACAVVRRDLPVLAEHGEGPYLRLLLTFSCPAGAPWALDAAGWLELDPGHRALLEYQDASGTSTQAVLGQAGARWSPSEPLTQRLCRFAAEGGVHLVTGYDHLAFLGVLLLGLLRRPSSASRPVLTHLLRRAGVLITAFTLAHSVTLGLAATGYIALPVQPVEVTIAASVVLAALLNFMRNAADHGWKLAFGFGLVHGLGFAGALGELAGGGIDLLALAAFNLGIEAAQLALAGVAVPILWWLLRDSRRERIGVPLASLVVASIGAAWTVSRIGF